MIDLLFIFLGLYNFKFFKTNTSNETVSGGENKLSKQKIQNIRNPFISKMIKKEIKDRNQSERKNIMKE